MARQLLTLAKIYPGANTRLDEQVARIGNGDPLEALLHPAQFDSGILYWASWLDDWSTGDIASPGEWPLNMAGTRLGGETWELSLTPEHPAIQTHFDQTLDNGLTRLHIHLAQAYDAHSHWNETALLFYERSVIGPSLDDSEIIGQST